jgi:poly-gamma-glutamate synthase PgsB/CapB
MVLLFVGYGIFEFIAHQRNLTAIPVRVHVNGTRGKSSVTRLIGAGLREGGIKTITKVTGTYPRLILEDGNEVEIFRKGGANIIEQLKIVKFARERKTEALVIECMALQPQYQRITEHQMIRASHAVITNVRLDHVDVMGYTLEDVAAALANTIPFGKKLFVGDKKSADLLRKHAEKNGSDLITAETEIVSDEEMKGFSYLEHKENVALALKICEEFDIPKNVALKGMYKAAPDEGVLRFHKVYDNGKKVTLYNAFAANDPESSMMIWEMIKPRISEDEEKIILLNTRGDRLDRAKQLAEMTGKNLSEEIDWLVLIGDSNEAVMSVAVRNSFDKNKIALLGRVEPKEVFNAVFSRIKKDATVLAIGNMGGMGAETIEYFKKRSEK